MAVKAKAYTIGGFSAHADQNDLLEWVGHFSESRPKIFVVHGEALSSEALAEKIRGKLNLETHVPAWKERLILKPREVISETLPEEKEKPENLLQTSLNSIIDLENELDSLKRRLKKKESEISEDEIDMLKYIREELQNIQCG